MKKLQRGYRLEIIVHLSRKPMSIKGLAQTLKAKPDTVARDVRSLQRYSLVRLSANGARHKYITASRSNPRDDPKTQ